MELLLEVMGSKAICLPFGAMVVRRLRNDPEMAPNINTARAIRQELSQNQWESKFFKIEFP